MTLAAASLVSLATVLAAPAGTARENVVAWAEPPIFGALTLPSRQTYTILWAGTLRPSARGPLDLARNTARGAAPVFMISYASDTERHSELVLAARALFEAFRLLAEKLGHVNVVVLAYFDVASERDLGGARTYGIGFDRRDDGSWVMTPPKAHVAETSRKTPIRRPKPDIRAQKDARACASAWLASVDRDRPDETWSSASPLFKSRVTSEAWAAASKEVRERKGRALDRRLLSVLERRRAPGFPDGTYVAFDYDSRFERAGDVVRRVERVSTVRGDDGIWRVTGYAVY